MKLYFKQAWFSMRQKTDVFDAQGNIIYTAQADFPSFGRKMHIYDSYQREVGYVCQQLFRFKPRFSVYVDGQYLADIVKDITFFRQSFRLEGIDWIVEGDFGCHDYEILSNGRRIASIHKKWFSLGDAFEIDIVRPEDVIPVLGVVIAIDCVLEDAENSSSTTI